MSEQVKEISIKGGVKKSSITYNYRFPNERLLFEVCKLCEAIGAGGNTISEVIETDLMHCGEKQITICWKMAGEND